MKGSFTVTTTLQRQVLSNNTKRRLKNIARYVLGAHYELSLVLIGESRSKTLNHMYRKKNTPTNILAFPLSDTIGEIFINIPTSIREARTQKIPQSKHITNLFIHACLHLKGYTHGATMDTQERNLCKRFI